MSPELLETIRTSPLTPWVGGAILIFVVIGLVKFIAKTIGKLVMTAIIALVGFLGWNWWGEPDHRTFGTIGNDWFDSLKSTDFSQSSLQALAQDTSKLLKEATQVSQAKGREYTKTALANMAESLKEKMLEAGKEGNKDAQREIQQLHETLMARLQ